ILTVSPEFLPSQNFRIVQEQAPEGDKVAIARSIAGPRGAHKFIQFDQALTRSFNRDAALATSLAAVLAEASERGAGVRAAVARAGGVIERPLPLRAPHNAIHFMRLDVIFDQRCKEVTNIRVIETCLAGAPPVDVHLSDLLKAGDQARIVDVLEPAITPYAARFGLGYDRREQIEIAQVGRAQVFEDCLAVVLWMKSRVAPAVESF